MIHINTIKKFARNNNVNVIQTRYKTKYENNYIFINKVVTFADVPILKHNITKKIENGFEIHNNSGSWKITKNNL